MPVKYFLFCVFLFTTSSLYAQIGGLHAYKFMNLPSSARATYSGGNLIATGDRDLALSWHNPSLLQEKHHQALSFNSAFFPTGVQWGFAGYGHKFEGIGMFQTGFQFVNYGTIDATNETGQITGSSSAMDAAFGAGFATNYERYTFGTNLKFIYSQIGSYNSFGVVADFAGNYEDTTNRWMVTLVIRNVGGMITGYTENSRHPLPAEIQLGYTKRLEHLPFRFHIMAHNLQNWNLRYDDPFDTGANLFGVTDTAESKDPFLAGFGDELLRHLIFGGEFYFGKNFRIGFGYNHQKRREMAIESRRGLTGFSFGAGVRINRFEFYYGRSQYHLAGSINHLSISTNINSFK